MHKNKIAIIVLLLICLSLAIVCLKLLYSSQSAGNEIIDQSTEVEKNEDSIAVPGYESLNLIANSKYQNIALSNPETNTCSFKIYLLLDDGTVLWESNYIKPGRQEDVVLNKPLKAGTYENSKLIYKCFKMDINKTPLNGAETKLVLIVE